MLVDGQRVRGAEIGLMGRITPQWSVMGGYAYTDAEITRAITGASAGAVVAQVPKHTVSMWNRYDFTPFLGLGLGVVHRSSMYAALDNTGAFTGLYADGCGDVRQAQQGLARPGEHRKSSQYRLHCSANNNNNISPGAPRIFRLTLVANF